MQVKLPITVPKDYDAFLLRTAIYYIKYFLLEFTYKHRYHSFNEITNKGEKSMNIREIEPKDNPVIEAIIKNSLESVGLNIEGTAYFDPHLGKLSEFYNQLSHSKYWVAEIDNKVVGGIGIAVFDEGKEICELQKLYLSPEAQGKGCAIKLMETAINFAEKHYQYCYLETRHDLKAASSLYKKFEFDLLQEPLNGSEHSAMDAWYLKKLK
ncbi:putative acetyltransferase [Cytobacillus horneckiae]